MPHMGSEPGVGWHWIIEMSKYFELWVLVHKEPVDDIEKYVKEKGIDKKIHFIYYDIPGNALFFKNGKFRWVRTYYLIWTMLANRIVKKTMKENNIEIFHHLTFGNAIWPVSRYGQRQFFVWGPIGGVETIPAEYSKYYGLKSRFMEFLRRLMVYMIRWSPWFNWRCRNANLILCKTDSMRRMVPKKYQNKTELFTDVAVDLPFQEQDVINQEKEELRYLAVGRLDAWRGFDVLIDAFCKAHNQYTHMKLTILGDGEDENRLKTLIARKGANSYIVLAGRVTPREYFQEMYMSDVVVNSSLKEGAVTVSFDSLRYGKPLICVDTGGYTRCFSDDFAIVLPRQDRDGLILAMTNALLYLTDKKKREMMGLISKAVGQKFLWEEKGKQIFQIIQKGYTNFNYKEL